MSSGPYIGVDVAILDGDRVLLTRREDFDVWCMPGGAVSPGESLAQTAIREAWEETGLEIELFRLVGVYSYPHWHYGGSHIVTFAGRPSGGHLRIQQDEVVEVGYFARDEVPQALLMGVHQRIQDALGGLGGGIAGYTPGEWPFPPEMNRESVYRMRDLSGLSRQEFYQQYFNERDRANLIEEVPSNGDLKAKVTSGIDIKRIGSDVDSFSLGQPMIGAGVVVVQDGKVLLTKREDFEVWCLPGGSVDEGESVSQAAVREIGEETGLKVELDRLVGVYSEPKWFNHGLHVVIFAGHPIGGRVRLQPAEVVELGFFAMKDLPGDMLVGHRERLAHALQGVGGGVARSQFTNWPFRLGITREEIYAIRDASELGRREFYIQTFSEHDADERRVEVGP